MDITGEFGISKRGCPTFLLRGFEYCKHRITKEGETVWRCSLVRSLKCKASLVSDGVRLVRFNNEDHNHEGNGDRALAKKAVGQMEAMITETLAGSSSTQGLVAEVSAMATSPDKQSLRTFLADTVTLLCKNFLHFESEFSVEGLIGITLDQKDVFLINIHETVKSPNAAKVPTPKSTESESLVVKSTTESNVTTACNVTLPQSTTSVEDDSKATVIIRDSTEIEMSHVADIARQPVARLPNVMLSDDVIKCDDSSADVKLEVGSTRSLFPDQTHDSKMYEGDLSSSTEQIQNSVVLPLALESHVHLETTACDDLKTFDKLDYSEKSSKRENRLTSDCRRSGFSQSRDFEVIEIKEESLSGDELLISDPNSQLGMTPMQACSQDYGTGTSSAMDTSPCMGYSYWEGNPINAVQAINQSTISVSSSAPNPGDVPVKRGPKRKFYECQKCGSKLTTAYGLKKHDTVIHQGNYKYTCHLCGKGLRTEYNLRGHMASRHNMSKDYRCTICSREFGYRHTLRDHMVTCHGVTGSFDLDNSGLAT